jgi:hypothetical protein
MIGRGLLVALAALLLATQVVRSAAVSAWFETQPQRAASLWGDHPDVELSNGMIGIAKAMHDRKAVDASVFTLIDDAARKAPLEPEPYLVRGVQAKLAGDGKLAEKAFRAAQLRDPRSLPAAYFLTEYYFLDGDAARGLKQIAALARLSPEGTRTVAPYIAAYAQNRANWPLLRTLLSSEPALADGALAVMANDPANVEAILALADGRQRQPSATWLSPMLSSLIQAGQYAKAQAVWASISHVRAAPTLYNPDFAASTAPPPFNWELTSSTIGLAERLPGGRLHAVFYGQEDGPLARQLVLLPAGSHRLSVRLVEGATHPDALNWVVRCDKADQEIARIRLDVAATRGWTFVVPAGCPAQWLELSGNSAEMPQQSDVTIAGLRLVPGGGGG